jgi:hypothetical protein
MMMRAVVAVRLPSSTRPGVEDAGVEKGRHRRGRLHDLGQPAVGGELGRLQSGGDRHAHRGEPEARDRPGGGLGLGLLEDLGQVAGAGGAPEDEGADHQEGVADAGGDELLAGGDHGPGPAGVEDQQRVEGDAGGHPGGDQQGEVAGDDHDLDRGDRDGEAAEEGALALVAVEVGAAVAHDHRGEHRDHGEHGDAQGVEADRHPEAVDADRRAGRGAPEGDRCDRGEADDDAAHRGDGAEPLDQHRPGARLAPGGEGDDGEQDGRHQAEEGEGGAHAAAPGRGVGKVMAVVIHETQNVNQEA